MGKPCHQCSQSVRSRRLPSRPVLGGVGHQRGPPRSEERRCLPQGDCQAEVRLHGATSNLPASAVELWTGGACECRGHRFAERLSRSASCCFFGILAKLTREPLRGKNTFPSS